MTFGAVLEQHVVVEITCPYVNLAKWSSDDIHIFVVTVNEGRRDETGDHGDGGGILFSYFLVQNMCGTESLEICGEQSVSEDYCR